MTMGVSGPEKISKASPAESARSVDRLVVGGIALTTFLLHLLVIERYGIFRDELYYLACSEHLSWGYVDHPPLSIAVLAAFP